MTPRLHLGQWLGILVMTLIGITAGYGWALLQTSAYTAEASGYVVSRHGAEMGAASPGDSVARSRVESYLAIAHWRTVAESAIDDLGLDTTPEALDTRVSVTTPQDTVIMNVSAKAATPEGARDLAEAWLRAMIVTIDSLESDGIEDSASVAVVAGDSHALPTAPSFPDIRMALIVGGALGLGLGIAFVRLGARRGP